MPKMTNAKSAPVLDSADAFEQKLRWILFKQENEEALRNLFAGWTIEDEKPIRDHNGDIIEAAPRFDPTNAIFWQPGRPMYKRPPKNYTTNGTQVVREMYNIFGLDGFTYEDDPLDSRPVRALRCRACEVSWEDDETRCWFCGEVQVILPPTYPPNQRVPRGRRGRRVTTEVSEDIDFNRLRIVFHDLQTGHRYYHIIDRSMLSDLYQTEIDELIEELRQAFIHTLDEMEAEREAEEAETLRRNLQRYAAADVLYVRALYANQLNPIPTPNAIRVQLGMDPLPAEESPYWVEINGDRIHLSHEQYEEMRRDVVASERNRPNVELNFNAEPFLAEMEAAQAHMGRLTELVDSIRATENECETDESEGNGD